jgi:nitrogen-specific signal transduction histidine kinase/CheY-like chemotaxis protein
MPAGALRWVEMTCIPVRGEHGGISRVAKLVRDVTEQRLLEDQILHQQRTSLASQLAITVAHQLRNPLGVMIGFAEMLSHGLPPDQMSNAVQRLLRNGLRCKEIVQNLLEFGRGAPGEHVLADLNAIVVNQVKPVYPASVAGRIAWRLAENLPPVECAPDQLAQVFINLLDNALWSAKSTVALETSSRDDSVYIRVWDDGPGVPEADREHIFEPFFTTRKDDGSIGLGLSLSRAVVQEHRGLLFLDDAVPQGACFVIQLPAAENIGGAAPVEAPPQALSRPGRRILIVEDETDLLFLLTMALESLGYTVDTAATGAHAMDLIEQTAYDAIVIDMLLADELGGGGLYRILQSARPQLTARSLFITGDTMKYETRRFLTEVRRPFLEKPFMIADFAQTVRDIIEAEKSNPAANGERA